MALTKSNGSLTQITASGTSGEISLADAYAAAVSLTHVNGTGTISAQATIQPQISHDGTNFHNDGGAFGGGTVASATTTFTYVPPVDGLPIAKVRFVYVAPTGSTGHTLDARYSKVTAL